MKVITQGVLAIVKMCLRPVQKTLEKFQTFIQQHADPISRGACGCMLGASIFLPTLFRTHMSSGGQDLILITTILVYLVSVTAFFYAKKTEIARNAVHTLPLLALPGVQVFLSAEQSILQVMLTIPFWFALGILVAVSVTPTARRMFRRDRSFSDLPTVESERGFSLRTNVATVDSGTVPTTAGYTLSLGAILGHPISMQHPHELSFIGGALDPPYFPGRPRTGDVEMGYGHDNTLSISSEGSNVPLLQLET